MRKRYRVLLLAIIVAALVVPVGFALSLESAGATPHVRYRAAVPISLATVSAPVLVPVHPSVTPVLQPIPDGAKLFAVGAALVGLAAVVRRSV
jgi:hypothetical protein